MKLGLLPKRLKAQTICDMSFWKIFENRNKYNEKNIVGFLSFAMMTLFAITDILTGLWGQPLVINDIIFNSFVYITLGTFGIAEAGKIFSKYNNKQEED
jgi:hypothetical protein